MTAQQLLSREGPAVEEVQIIAVELAVTDPRMGREVELDMFACRHTLPRIEPYAGRRLVRITLHSSAGDFTMRDMAPW